MKATPQTLIALFAVAFASHALAQKTNETDEQGRKQGQWQKTYANGTVRYTGSFVDDQPVGTFFYYDEKGRKTSQVSYRTGTDSADAIFFHTNSAVMGSGVYRNQLKEGVWKFYDNQSILSAVEEFKGGVLHGKSRVFYLNGALAGEFLYVDGLKNGPFKEYFPDSTLKIEGTYVNNTFDGPYVQYFSDGTVYVKGQYKAAVRDGHWVYFAEDGRIKAQRVYEKGELIKEKIEPGFERESLDAEVDEEETIDEQKLMEEWYSPRNIDE